MVEGVGHRLGLRRCDGAPAQSLSSLSNTKPDGLGLGLSLCKTIIESHSGRVWFKPGSPCGATFSFLLPSEERVFEPTVPPIPRLEQ